MRPEFAAVPFEDRAKAESNLLRLDKKLRAELAGPLASLLLHSPDPDGALNLLERYAEAAPAEVLEEIGRTPTALTYLVAIFGTSAYLAESFLAEPALAAQFARDRKFTRLKSKEELMQDYARFATTNPDHWLSSQLARFKRRNYLRIVLNDVLGLSTLGETTLELSLLADVVLTYALAFCDQELEKRYGQPQYRDPQGRIVRSGFSIASLGKLGGNELNYSSDIDLLFLYERDGETAGGSERDSIISNKEYFVRLAHAVTRTISQTTPHGEVFRVDLRLRPEGEMGDLAISVKSALEYYEHRARDWELQMLIKARHSAGEPRVLREFLRGVEGYVYAAPGDFEAVESVMWSREKISQKLSATAEKAIDVKQQSGGIRDIEFLTQCLQRLHGGRDAWVRSGGTLLALRKLNDKGWLSDRDYAALVNSYQFLRQIEHRIQFEQGRQTHRLPEEPEALNRLARRAGMEGRGAPGDALVQKLEATFARVGEIYERVIHPHAGARAGAAYELKPSVAPPGDQGLPSYAALVEFLSAQAPELAELVGPDKVPERARHKATRLFSALLASPEKFRSARLEPWRLERALELTGMSEYLADMIIRHPGSITALDPFVPAPSEATEQMSIALDASVDVAPYPWAGEKGIDARSKMGLLRRHYRERVLELASADVAGMTSVFAALGRWSMVAVRSVASALLIGQESLDDGGPSAPEGGETAAMVVLGLGRLGLNEFDLASDADLMFVAPSGSTREAMAAHTRLAEKTIEALSSYTRDGTLFAVDTRLRPRGQEGDLVVTESALLSYISDAAQVWEASTYLKACPIAGDPAQARAMVARLVERVFDRFESHPNVESELQEMRRRLEREMNVPPTDIKTGPGGYYDIDFAISCLRLRHRLRMPPGSNTPQQIRGIEQAGVVRSEDAQALTEGAVFLRSVDHAVRLVTGKPAEGLPEHPGHREAVENLAGRWRLVKEGTSLAKQLREVQEGVRSVYRRVTGSE